MLTPDEITAYQKSCNLRACVVGYEGQSLSNGSTLDDYSLMFARHLMPIDGDDFTHEDEREKELVNG